MITRHIFTTRRMTTLTDTLTALAIAGLLTVGLLAYFDVLFV